MTHAAPSSTDERASTTTSDESNMLTAVDILLDPDASMLQLAATYNSRLLASIPSPPGFVLDDNHRPHITVLQRYVRTSALDEMYETIRGLLATIDVSTLTLTAHGLAHLEEQPSIGIGAIVVSPGPEVVDFQEALITAVLPHTESGGSAGAFVRTEAEPLINDKKIEYIEKYVPEHSGANYVAHVTVGMAMIDDLIALETEPFEPLAFSAGAIGIYHLGNNGTAARRLTSWDARAR